MDKRCILLNHINMDIVSSGSNLMNRRALLEGLTNEQLEKARACKSSEELLALAAVEGVELNDEQLAVVNGGCAEADRPNLGTCPMCNSPHAKGKLGYDKKSRNGYQCVCLECGHQWFQL